MTVAVVELWYEIPTDEGNLRFHTWTAGKTAALALYHWRRKNRMTPTETHVLCSGIRKVVKHNSNFTMPPHSRVGRHSIELNQEKR